LFRATEIKQPKRREALIENAEKARISRKLVLLDDKVKLDVPLDDLAVQEPDAKKLIAFLKAMEFSTLTRRVAEFSQIDPGQIEASASPAPARAGFAEANALAPSPANGKEQDKAKAAPSKASGDRSDKASSPKGTPASLADARAEAARKTPVDRSKY